MTKIHIIWLKNTKINGNQWKSMKTKEINGNQWKSRESIEIAINWIKMTLFSHFFDFWRFLVNFWSFLTEHRLWAGVLLYFWSFLIEHRLWAGVLNIWSIFNRFLTIFNDFSLAIIYIFARLLIGILNSCKSYIFDISCFTTIK